MREGEETGQFGAIDLPALQRIRSLWLDLEPLVEHSEYDDPIAPTKLRIELRDGIGPASTAQFEVQWSHLGNYSFHYVDEANLNWRFDRHPNPHSPVRHFHPPPDAADAEPSCIQVDEASLVTRAVQKLWRAAYESGNLDQLNSASNPP
jgi:hypothetical protein